MTVTALRMRPWHIWALIRTFMLRNRVSINVVPFDGSITPVLRALAFSIPGLGGGKQAYGAWIGQQLVGFLLVEFPSDRRSVSVLGITAVAVDTSFYDAVGAKGAATVQGISEALLQRVSNVAVRDGFLSVCVRLPIDSPFFDAFTRLGFVSAVREDVYIRLPGPMGAPQVIEGLRIREPADTWDVSQLYRVIFPAAVQLAGFPDSECPDGSQGHLFGGWLAGRTEEFVVLSSGASGIDAWVRVSAAHRGQHNVEVMIHPRSALLAGELIRFALWSLTREAPIPTQVIVRSDEDVLRCAAESQGFVLTTTRELLVRQMAVRMHARVLGHAFDRVTS